MFSTPRRRTAGWVLLSVTAAAVVLGVIVSVVSIWQLTDDVHTTTEKVRATQLEGTPLGKQLAASAERILDCTEPDGQCYKDGQKRTAQAVGDINRVIVLAAACSVGLAPDLTVDQRQISIQECVISRLALRATKP